MTDRLYIWVIYHRPLDFPDVPYVARRQWVRGDEIEYDPDHFEADTLEEIRAKIPWGLVKIGRYPDDDPVIVECWM